MRTYSNKRDNFNYDEHFYSELFMERIDLLLFLF